MKHRRRPIATHRTVIAVLMAIALLFQGAFAIACGLHDLSHVDVAAHDAGHAVHDEYGQHHDSPQADQGGPATEDGWHALFAAGHWCLQVFGTATSISVEPVRLPAIDLPSPAANGAPPAPFSLLLRPPIDA